MKIVPFTKADQQATETFMRTIYQEMGWTPEPHEGLDNLENFFHIPTAEGFLLIVKDEDKIVGTGGCIKLNDSDVVMKRFYIGSEYRGKGLAQELFKKIIDIAKTLSVTRVVIDVGKINMRALHFYEKYGFKEYHPTPVAMWTESSHPEKFNYYFFNIE